MALGAPAAADAVVAHIRITGPTKATRIVEVQEDSHVVSDGVRYLAFSASRRARFRLFDTWRRRMLRPKTHCAPQDLYDAEAAIPALFLTTCGQLLDATTLRAKRIRGARPDDAFYQLGRYWVEGEFGTDCFDDSDGCRTGTLVINWHTGKRVTCGESPDRRCPYTDWNLDAPKLRAVPRNHPRPDSLVNGILGYDGPYRLMQSRVASNQVLRLRQGGDSIELARRRCCWSNPFNGTLSSGWATWTTSRHRGVYIAGAIALRPRKRLTWNISGVPYPFAGNVTTGFPPYVWHTASGVVFQTLKRFIRNEDGALDITEYQLAYAPFPG